MNKKIYIFHHNDTDGRMAAAVMVEYFRTKMVLHWNDPATYDTNNIVLHEIDYTINLNDVEPLEGTYDSTDIIVFVDYSFSNDANVTYLKYLLNQHFNVIWIDHHRSSLIPAKEVAKSATLNHYIDTTYCAAYLCYLWARDLLIKDDGIAQLFVKPVPDILKYCDSYDTWKHDMESTDEWHYGVMAYGIDPMTFFKNIIRKNSYNIFDYDEYVEKKLNGFNHRRIEDGTAISRYLRQENAGYVENWSFEFTINDIDKCRRIDVLALNRRGNSLMFGDAYEEFDAVCAFAYKNGQWVYSLYGCGDNDLNYYAEIIGHEKTFGGTSGGGHPGAAGFVLRDQILKPGCNIIITRKLISKRACAYVMYE